MVDATWSQAAGAAAHPAEENHHDPFYSAPAAAQSVRYVSYGDLDLSNSAGETTLRDRVSTAVNQVCGRRDSRNVHSLRAVESCRRVTWAMTEPQLNEVLGSPTVEILAHARIVVGKARTAAH
jgi:UrcA family protein